MIGGSQHGGGASLCLSTLTPVESQLLAAVNLAVMCLSQKQGWLVMIKSMLAIAFQGRHVLFPPRGFLPFSDSFKQGMPITRRMLRR